MNYLTGLQKPKERSDWKVMGLGWGSLAVWPVLGLVNYFYRKFFDPESFKPNQYLEAGLPGMVLGLAAAIAAIRLFFKSYKAGERSWMLWFGLVPAVVVTGFWIFMIAGEFLYPH